MCDILRFVVWILVVIAVIGLESVVAKPARAGFSSRS